MKKPKKHLRVKARRDASRKKRGKGRQKSSGRRFESRVKHAFQFIHPEKMVNHDEHLEAIYGRLRQFDVTVRGQGVLERALEAKDYGRRVAQEKVDAFETKLAELKIPPTKGGAMVSRSGYQEGPIQRARFLQENPTTQARVRDLYQLRSARPEDWSDRIRQVEIQLSTSTLMPANVRVRLAGAERECTEGVPRKWDRGSSFFYGPDGHAVGNLLDALNEKIAESRNMPSLPSQRISLKLPEGWGLRVDGQLLRIAEITFDAVPNNVESHVRFDIGSAARDTLIDCVGDQKWIIPDPEKALSASRDGLNIAFRFDEHPDLNAFDLPKEMEADETRRLANAIQLRIALNSLRAMTASEDPPQDVVNLVESATRAFLERDYATAKKLYWQSCEKASSLVALVNLTYIYEQEGDLDQARHLAVQTAHLFPLEENGFVNCIHVAIRRGDLSDARKTLEAAKWLHAGIPALKRVEGELLFHEKRYDDACGCFMDLFHRGIEPGENRLNTALCESRLGRFEEAAWDAAQAWATEKVPADRAPIIVDFLLKAGLSAEACEIGIDALEGGTESLGSSWDLFRLTVARACCDSNRPKDAEKVLSTVENSSRDPRYDHVLGLVRFQQGRYSEALSHFQEFVRKVPDNSAGHWAVAVAAVESREPSVARVSLERCTECDAGRPSWYWLIRARTYAMLGDLVETSQSIQHVVTCGGDEAQAWVLASNAAFSARKEKLAFELRLRCKDVASNDPDIVLEQALVLLDCRSADSSIDGSRILALIARAEASAKKALLFFAKMLYGLRIDSSMTGKIWTERPKTLPAPLACVLAAEACFTGQFGIALDLIEGFETSGGSVTKDLGLPHPSAIAAGALFGLGRLEEAARTITDPNIDYPHPCHKLMCAYLAYADGHLDAAIGLLDEVERMVGKNLEAAILRLQCLVEAGRYRESFALIQLLVPDTPLVELGRWMSQDGTRDAPPKDALSKLDGSPLEWNPFLRTNTEHIVVLLSGNNPFVVVDADSWESGLSFGRQLRESATPIFLRVRTPVRTIERLRSTGLKKRNRSPSAA
jgi:Flp pilus assembly protein TadD